MVTHYTNSAELRQAVAAESGGRVILSFSRGKDSCAAWLALREHFPEIVPFYMERIPGISFIEESLDYFERYFGAKIHRVPHPATYRQLRAHVFQPPERWPVIEAAIEAGRLPSITYAGQEKVIRDRVGADLPVCWGTRAKDSPLRMANVLKHGPRNLERGAFWGIYDWPMKQVVDTLARAKVRLPADYRLFGRSFDGIDYRYLKPLRREYPADYQRVLDWFPLAELELYRREAAKHPIDDDPAWSRAFSEGTF